MLKKAIVILGLSLFAVQAFSIGGFEAMKAQTDGGLTVVIIEEGTGIYGYMFTEFDGEVEVLQNRKVMVDLGYGSGELTIATKAQVRGGNAAQWSVSGAQLTIESKRLINKIKNSGVSEFEINRASVKPTTPNEAFDLVVSKLKRAKSN